MLGARARAGSVWASADVSDALDDVFVKRARLGPGFLEQRFCRARAGLDDIEKAVPRRRHLLVNGRKFVRHLGTELHNLQLETADAAFQNFVISASVRTRSRDPGGSGR